MFNVKDIVHVPSRRALTLYGSITELHPDSKAIIIFWIPREPKERNACDECGSATLSVNGSTGEIVCMRSGCGHEHGFKSREEVISLDLLVNITTKRQEEKKAAFRKRLNDLLEEGVKEKFLTPEASDRILKTV